MNLKNELQILYNDKSITVCIKPYGVLSQKDAKGGIDMIELLSSQYSDKTDYKVIHRLDFNVGGVMVYGKDDTSAASLSEQIRNKSFEKEYLAVVIGCPTESSGIYKDLLFKDSSKNKTFVVNKMRRGVREASLEYKVLKTEATEKGQLSLVWIKLHTGRTHQIRVQFASRGTPVYGDGRYGGKAESKNCALWSYKIKFAHPTISEKLCFSNNPPQIFPWNIFNINT